MLQTLEIIGLVVVHPLSPQPFSVASSLLRPLDGTRALVEHIEALSCAEMREQLLELTRLPSHASVAFEVANERAQGTFHEDRMLHIRRFFLEEPLNSLKDTAGAVMASRATLIVVPISIQHQWVAEIRRWAPQLSIVVYDELASFADTPRTARVQKDIRLMEEAGGGWWWCPHDKTSFSNCAAGDSNGWNWRDITHCEMCLTRIWSPRQNMTENPVAAAEDVCVRCNSMGITRQPARACCAARGGEQARLRQLAALACADIVLASYETMEVEANRARRDRRPGLLQAMWWHRVVLDEIQLLEGQVCLIEGVVREGPIK